MENPRISGEPVEGSEPMGPIRQQVRRHNRAWLRAGTRARLSWVILSLSVPQFPCLGDDNRILFF